MKNYLIIMWNMRYEDGQEEEVVMEVTVIQDVWYPCKFPISAQ